MANKFRPVAVPLVTVDPFFSIWSCADHLHADVTRNWTEIPNPLVIAVKANNKLWSITNFDPSGTPARNKMYQSGLKVTPLSTEYTFECDDVNVKLTFTTPLLLDRPDILARPVSYVSYEIERKCAEDVCLEFFFGVSSRCTVRGAYQTVEFKKTPYSLSCGNTVQNVLSYSADQEGLDWGYLHLCDPKAFPLSADALAHPNASNLRRLSMSCTYNAYKDSPYVAMSSWDLSGVITLAYDEVKPIEYFGTQLDEYYTKYFSSFEEMVKAAKSEYAEIKALCDKFDEELMAEAGALGEDYKNIVSLAYRQAISAHKLVADTEGNILFLSKENESNGCIGTLDVTYPSIPLFLKYNPEFVNGMLRPIIKYAKSDEWIYEFAPHDVGQYPLANGQVYSMYKTPAYYTPEARLAKQMPIEECGNMLLCLAAVKKYSGECPLFDADRELMKQWTDYMVEYGYDPGHQLCTDDFAGHLNHNCNLSLKAILGIASYAMLSGDASYMEIAKKYAKQWEIDAKASHGATRLVFDNPDGWSMKYNMVWDNLLGFGLFSDEVKKNEIKQYTAKLNRYGVPLDSRKDYTKIDWLMWATCIYDDKEFFAKVCKSIADMISETQDRVPIGDWYETKNAKHIRFQARSVVGGLFINLLD